MFALEINFHDGVSPPEVILVRRPQAIIGGSEYAHVVIEGSSSGLYELRLTRGIGSEFTCQPVSRSEQHQGSHEFLEGTYSGSAEFNLGDVTTHITSLDADLLLENGESPDRAGVRILRKALSRPTPAFPAIAVLGHQPMFLSFLEGESVLVGRSRKCGLRLDAADVSSEHARFGFRDGGFWVEDLGSTNGTSVNGERISGRRTLQPDETVQLGAEFSLAGVNSAEDLSELNQRKTKAPEPSPALKRYPCLVANSELVRPMELVLQPGDSVVIGRDPANTVWIGAAHISRRHAEIRRSEEGAISAIDFSTNGTKHSGERLPSSEFMTLPDGLCSLEFGAGIEIAICRSPDDEERFLNGPSESEIDAAEPLAHAAGGTEETVFGVGASDDAPLSSSAALDQALGEPEEEPSDNVFARLAARSQGSVSQEEAPKRSALEMLATGAAGATGAAETGDAGGTGIPGATGSAPTEVHDIDSALEFLSETESQFDNVPILGRLGRSIMMLGVVGLVAIVSFLIVWFIGGPLLQ